MLKVIVGVRRSGKTSKMRQLIEDCDLIPIVISMNPSRDRYKFLDTRIVTSITQEFLDERHAIFIDDAENLDDPYYPYLRYVHEAQLNITIAFSPQVIDLTWHSLPFWWLAWQRADKVIQLPSNWSEKELTDMGRNIGNETLFRTQFKGDVLFKTRHGLMEMKHVK